MKYRCLRNCFINGQIYLKDEVHELSDNISERHFQPVEQPVEVEPEPKPEPVKPDKIPAGMFWCVKHNTLHRLNSSTGKKCLKRIEAEITRGAEALET